MAPECFQNKPASTAGDIWASGCIVHHVMTGDVLFMSDIKEENERQKVVGRIMNQIPCRLPKHYSRPLRY